MLDRQRSMRASLFLVVCLGTLSYAPACEPMTNRIRRILLNLDGDSCMFLKRDVQGPTSIGAIDLANLIGQITGEKSQVDSILICINAQVMYYPTKIGTMRGHDSNPAERAAWPASERQRSKNLDAMFAAGVDPYAVLLTQARKRGREALLSFRMNDAHGNDFLRTAFWRTNPQFRLPKGALDFKHEAVHNYIVSLIEESVQRYDCDGLELDFQRFPTFFSDLSTDERIAVINRLVERIRRIVDATAAKRGRKLLLAARVPSDFGRSPPSYERSRAIGCDPVAWTKNGWVDFVTVSEFLFQRDRMPIRPWKRLMPATPIYGGIECATGPKLEQCLDAAGYRKAAMRLWADGADGIYLFNFFTTREWNDKAFEPPFEALNDIGSTGQPVP